MIIMFLQSIQGKYAQAEYDEINTIKKASGLTWDAFIYEAAKAYAKMRRMKK